MAFHAATIILLQVVVHSSRQAWAKTGDVGLVQDHTTYEDEHPGCSYPGYSPGFTPPLTKMVHHTATLQVDAIQNAFICSDMIIATGVIGSGQELMDGVNEAVRHTQDMLAKNKKVLYAGLAGLKTFAKFASVASPVLGVLTASLGAVTGERTPTHEDILKATNKALDKLTDEVDKKLEEMKAYVDEKVIQLEKDINKRKYTFLFKYWGECSGLETEDEVDLCQREAYRLIVASIDEFLIFQHRMDKKKAAINNPPLTDEEKRRIEIGMVSFRNYALLSLLSLKTLAATYEKLRNELERKPKQTCAELRLEELRNQDNKDWEPRPKHKFMCLYKEELALKAIYFERYGNAAIKAIKEVARSRLTDQISYEDKETNNRHNGNSMSLRKNAGGYFQEKKVQCAAKIHPMKIQPCRYSVQLVEHPPFNDKRYSNEWQRWYLKDPLKAYTTTEKVRDSDLVSANYRQTKQWCHERIKRRRSEYNAMEQHDVERYWAQEVMKVVICGRLLVEGKIKDCEEKSIKPHYSIAYGFYRDLMVSVGWKPEGESYRQLTWNHLETVDLPKNLNQPLIIESNGKIIPNNIEFIRIEFQENTDPLKLAEVRVFGTATSEASLPEPTEYVVRMKNAEQISTSVSADNAIDGLITTISKTKEGSGEMWWMAEINELPQQSVDGKTKTKVEFMVTAVNVQFNGTYRSVKIETSNDKKRWTQCGDIAGRVDDEGYTGFEQQCEGKNDAEDKWVRITATPDSSVGTKQLMIKEVEVTAQELETRG